MSIERRERYFHLEKDDGKPMFAIRRMMVRYPLIEGAAYGTEMIERRKVNRRSTDIDTTTKRPENTPNVKVRGCGDESEK